MKIEPQVGTPRVDDTSSSQVRRPQWSVGQLLQATVSTDRSGGLLLLIGAHRHPLSHNAELRPGQQLLVRVDALGDPVQLRLVAGADHDQPLQRALRWSLPRQTPLGNALTALGAQLNVPANATPARPVADLIQILLSALPAVEQLTRWGELRRAVRNCGAFLEAKLALALHAGQAPDIDSDLLAQLLRLLHALRSAAAPAPTTAMRAGAARPGSARDRDSRDVANSDDEEDMHAETQAHLAALAEAASARIRINQLARLLDTDTQDSAWAVEIPYRDGNLVRSLRLRAQREHRVLGQDGPAWTLMLEFDIAKLGPTRAQIRLLGTGLAVTLWAESAATAQLMQAHLSELATPLREAGLTLNAVACYRGVPDRADGARLDGSVDVRA